MLANLVVIVLQATEEETRSKKDRDWKAAERQRYSVIYWDAKLNYRNILHKTQLILSPAADKQTVVISFDVMVQCNHTSSLPESIQKCFVPNYTPCFVKVRPFYITLVGVRSIAISVSVSARISQKPHAQISRNFPYM